MVQLQIQHTTYETLLGRHAQRAMMRMISMKTTSKTVRLNFLLLCLVVIVLIAVVVVVVVVVVIVVFFFHVWLF